MSTAVTEIPQESRVNYLNASYGVKSWLFTVDHKRIALLYLVSITFMFLVGGGAAVLMRIHLIEPAGALVQPETYNKLFSAHGIIMVFFFLVPSIPATLGNFLVPLMIGAKDLAFPKLNLLSWYIYVVGALFTLYAVISGGVTYSAVLLASWVLAGRPAGPETDLLPQGAKLFGQRTPVISLGA